MDASRLVRAGMVGTALLALSVGSAACSSGDDAEEPSTATAAATAAATQATGSNTAVASTVTRVATSATQAASLPAGPTSRITVGDNFFSPASATTTVGSKVTWTWSGVAPHSVSGKFDGKDVFSPVNTGTGTFEFTFEKAGTFDYECGVHGPSMAGRIVVS